MAPLLFSGHLTHFPWRYRIVTARCPIPSAGCDAIGSSGRPCRSARRLRRLYFDTVLFEPQALHFLCEVAASDKVSDKVVLGSDYPFPTGDPEPARVAEETSLTEAARRAILCGTAARIFHIDCGCVGDC
jgi:predicted TIM-barrel fold metal-dependent hydrolase